jgi:hypothetical protein
MMHRYPTRHAQCAETARHYLRSATDADSVTHRMSIMTQLFEYLFDDPNLLSNTSFRDVLSRRIPAYHAEMRGMRRYARQITRHCAALERAMSRVESLLKK